MVLLDRHVAHLLVQNHLVLADFFVLLVVFLLFVLRKVDSHAFQKLLGQGGDVLIDFGENLLFVGHDLFHKPDEILPALIGNSFDTEHFLSFGLEKLFAEKRLHEKLGGNLKDQEFEFLVSDKLNLWVFGLGGTKLIDRRVHGVFLNLIHFTIKSHSQIFGITFIDTVSPLHLTVITRFSKPLHLKKLLPNHQVSVHISNGRIVGLRLTKAFELLLRKLNLAGILTHVVELLIVAGENVRFD